MNESDRDDPSPVEAPPGLTSRAPKGDDTRHVDDAGPGSLAERGSLLDEQGEDIRQYTGEPVETEEGWVIPRQQNVGPGNIVKQGEFPEGHAAERRRRPG